MSLIATGSPRPSGETAFTHPQILNIPRRNLQLYRNGIPEDGTHTGFVFDAGIRDAEENREIPNFNGFYRGYDPSAWAQMTLTS